MEGTPALLEALNNMIRASHNNVVNESPFNGAYVGLGAVVAAVALAALIVFR
jgi:hypothetical protein